jgi:hypothetical protein
MDPVRTIPSVVSEVLTFRCRFLVVEKEQLESSFAYIRSKTRGAKDKITPERIQQRRNLEQVFPRIVMTVTKAESQYGLGKTTYALSCTIYKSITASTFFSVCTTRRHRSKTIFCGASVYGKPLPPPRIGSRDDYRTVDSICLIRLEDGGAITGTAVRPDWFGEHDFQKDLIIWLNGDNGEASNYESLETLMRLVPALRNDEYGRLPTPYQIDIRGLGVDALRWVPKFVSTASSRLCLN